MINKFEILLKRLIFQIRWKKIFEKKKIPIWKNYHFNKKEISENLYGRKILFATSYGSHDISLKIDALIANKIKSLGHKAEFLFCDEFLTLCSQVNIFEFKNIDLLFSKGIKDKCIYCWGCAKKSIDQKKFIINQLSNHLKEEDYKKINDIFTQTEDKDILNFKYKNINVGEHAYSSTLRFFARGDLKEKNSDKILKMYFYSALLTLFSFSNLIKEKNYDTIVINHGLYVPQGIIMEIAKNNNIKVVTWFPSYKNKTFIYSHKDTYHKTFLTDKIDFWEKNDLDNEKEKRVIDYIESKNLIQNKNDWHVFQHKNSNLNFKDFAENIGIDTNKASIALFTNVMWDAQLYYDDNIFTNMLEWIFETIEFFKNKETQLIIRIHPAEDLGSLKSRQKVKDEIIKHIGKLPKNVFIIDASDNFSSYSIIKNTIFSIVYASTIANEIVSLGKNVIVAGEAWVKNKKISIDPKNKLEYFKMIDRLILDPSIKKDLIARARKFSYYFYFNRMIPIKSIVNDNKKISIFSIQKTIQSLQEGKNENGIQTIVNGIVNNKEFIHDEKN